MLLKPTIDLLKHNVRCEICASCPFRSAGTLTHGVVPPVRDCEKACPVFVHLSELDQCARCIDPMFSAKRAVMAEIRHIASPPRMQDGGEKREAPNPLLHHAQALSAIIGKAHNH